ncbi:MAG TPA: hypothetical protein VE954_23535 [Oligoflexus sp.]|uniref:hypothetical protein n=1 Tax=Oligoflexus sp. TaxID=1971216 RepID=UPI002D74F85A|nr:hypothetical protein [Oligoflexus sp.]HYX36085.1 hypothetical protein [Oligoflexus sp.]
MRLSILIGCLIFGLLSHEAQAFEWGLGAGRIQGCLARVGDEEAVCSMGPAMTASLGLNLWGADYRPEDHERDTFGEGTSSSMDTGFNLGLRVNDWDEVALVIVIALFLTTVGYALLYPVSSRVDVGITTRSGWQEQSGEDLQLWRNEAGIYLRAYLSQHFPMYIYGSGLLSYQNVSLGGAQETHQVFVKGLGFGFMSPTRAGPYFHGVWERSSFLDPKPKDLWQDASDVKIFKNSVAEILDGSYFELGYLWYR